tara:strand:- start:95 stop:1036 length:942 start_codon:yes stop_codon:yes gene_type:complete
MTSIDYFTFNNCYRVTDPSFDNYKDEIFQIYSVESADTCENLALDKETQFFLLSDFCNNTLLSNCYIPNVIVPDTFTGTLNNIFKPFSDILNRIFGNPNNRQPANFDSCSNLVMNENTNTCLHHLPSGKYYAPTEIFALYNSQTLDFDVVQALANIKSYSDYAKEFSGLDDYNDMIKLPHIDLQSESYRDGGIIATAFKNYICDPTNTTKERNFKARINDLDKKYNDMFLFLDKITHDLSNISLLTKNDNKIIMEMDTIIASKKYELEELLASGGGNNGRLADTNYLKNLKFIEIVIVSLVLLITIFIYIKKK